MSKINLDGMLLELNNLNSTFNHLYEHIEGIEKRLRQEKITFPVSCEILQNDNNPEFIYLSWDRDNMIKSRKYKIYLTFINKEKGITVYRKPLMKAKKDILVVAANHIDKLIDKMTQRFSEMQNEIKDQVNTF